MNTCDLDLLIEKKDIMFFSAIVESYEGVAFFRTVDPSIGHVRLMVPSFFVSEVNALLEDLARSVKMRFFDSEQAAKNNFKLV